MGSIQGKLKANGAKKNAGKPAPHPPPRQGNVIVKKGGKPPAEEKAVRNYGKKNGKPGDTFKVAKKGIAATAVVNQSSGPAAGAFARVEIHGFPLARVLRQLAAAGYTAAEVRAAFDVAGGMFSLIRTNTIRDKMGTRDAEKAHAELSKPQIAALMGKAK